MKDSAVLMGLESTCGANPAINRGAIYFSSLRDWNFFVSYRDKSRGYWLGVPAGLVAV
jgi:hypothetical protein